MRIILALIGILLYQQSFGQVPILNIDNKQEKHSLAITQMNIDVIVSANVATTTYDLVFFNPFTRDMEGELSMPMNEGQEISRYALSVNGKLREGVIVEKIKARQTYEAVVRQNIDPGIVNITKGNFFKTKVYPIPAGGTKRVVIAVSETLNGDENNLYYTLPIESKENIASFKLDVKVIKNKGSDYKITSGFENIEFDSEDDAYILSLERENFKTAKPLKFTIPRFAKSDHQLFTCDVDGKTYFYLTTKAPKLKKIAKKTVKNITVYWDNSFSADKRDLEKELKLLETYLESLKGRKNISLISFNYKEEAPKSFTIDKDAAKLLNYIRNLKNDGATSFNNIKLSHNTDEILIFSDAVNTIGKSEIKTNKIPVYTIVSVAGSNYSLLKKISSETNGEFINLNMLSVKQSLEILSYDQEKFLSYSYNNTQIAEVYPNRPTRIGNYFEVSGIIKSDNLPPGKAGAKLKINYGSNKGITATQSFEINNESTAPVSRIWAGKKIESLMFDYESNKEEILKLSQKHNIITKNTSFIVLDRIEDYVMHKILPPEELRETYYNLLAKQEKNKKEAPDRLMEENEKRINRLKSWYEKPPKISSNNKGNRANNTVFEDEEAIPVNERSENPPPPLRGSNESYDMMPPPPPPPASQRTGNSEDEYDFVLNDEVALEEEEEVYNFRVVEKRSNQRSKSKIKVLAWQPDAPYMKTLRKLEAKDLDSAYFELKKDNKTRPAFYIQVSELLFEKKQNNKAIRVLSNTVELDLENPELLKTVARRLLNNGEYDMAIKIFTEVKELRPEEPQSFRDLAHAYSLSGQYQKALDLYLYIIEHRWNRFEEIKDIVFNEMNNLIALHKDELNISKVDKKYIKAMPLDVRITLEWSSNDNDIDLWVIDPNGEKCYYQHKATKIGGKISYDFTRGYGPEEFSLKEAIRGTYTV
ncbi:MAG: VIT domain-containing protein, partial [Bacteroidota bacterium]